MSKMGHGYGNGVLGRADGGRVPAGAIGHGEGGAQQLHRCGAFDDDDFFIYIGGLAAAVRSILALASQGRPAAGRAALGIELDPGIGFNITRKFH